MYILYKVQYINKRNPSFQIDQILSLAKCFVFFLGDIPWVTLQCHQTWLEKSADFRRLGTTARKTKAASNRHQFCLKAGLNLEFADEIHIQFKS